MNARIYQPLCMFCLVLLQFVYPPQTKAQTAAHTPLVTAAPWQKQDDLIESKLPGKFTTEMKKIVGGLATWAQQSGIDSLGCSPAWCGAYFSNKASSLPLFKYEMRAGFYTGNMGMVNADPGKESRLAITANDLSTLQETFSLNGNDYMSLAPMQQLYDGIRYIETATPKTDETDARQTRTWLITYAGALPYPILSRKEYLGEALKEIAADKQRLKEDLRQRIPVKTAKQEEVSRQSEIDAINNMYSGATRDSRVRSYLASYKPDSIYFKEAFASQSAPLDADSVLLDSILMRSPAVFLEKPAVVTVPAHAFRSFEDDQPGGRMLAKWNINYFNKDMSLAKPQFFVVSWQYDPSDVVAVNLDKSMSQLNYCDLLGLLTASSAPAK